MTIFGLILLSLVAGAIAREVWQGPRPEGLLSTCALGIAGVAAGSVVSGATGLGRIVAVSDLATWVTATTWACVLVAACGAVVTTAHAIGARVSAGSGREA